MKKPSRKTLVRKLDAVHSTYIRTRDKRCVTCGTDKNLTNGHLFSRVHHSTRWNDLNCHAQCVGCNYRHEFDPYPFNRWFITKFGQDAWDRLYLLHTKAVKFKNYQLEEMFEMIERKRIALEELRSGVPGNK